MTESTPNPARHGLEGHSPPPRRRFVLARLATAVRRQDWFTVLVEIAIVVLGVVIGYQVNDWGQSRSDRAKEQTYLRQLAADLAETERRMDLRDARVNEQVAYGLAHLLAEFGSPSEPPADTVLSWLQRGAYIPSPRPVLGTAEGLLASGDLTVIGNDSLRVAISAYLDATREHQADHALALRLAIEHSEALWGRVDLREAVAICLAALPDSVAEADRARATFAFLPERGWKAPFPLDPGTFFRDRTAYATLSGLARMQAALAEDRNGMRAEARALRQRVEAYLSQ